MHQRGGIRGPLVLNGVLKTGIHSYTRSLMCQSTAESNSAAEHQFPVTVYHGVLLRPAKSYTLRYTPYTPRL